MSKLEKILKREKYFVELAKCSRLYCLKHEIYLTPFQVLDKHCYNGNHGIKSCQYVMRKP